MIGASNLSKDRLTGSLETAIQNNLPLYQTLQPLYNLYEREKFETDYRGICEKYGLSVLPYYSLASGFLSGKYRSDNDISKSLRGKGIKKEYINERGFKILRALDKIAGEYQAQPAAIAIAWLLSKPLVTAPVVSATNTHQLEEIIKATSIHLNDEAIEVLEEN